jgi:hypothetical protein
MPAEAEWVQRKLKEIAEKRAILAALKDSLDAWERDVDWGELSAARREALTRLARESAATLRTLISRVNGQISLSLNALAQSVEPPHREQ